MKKFLKLRPVLQVVIVTLVATAASAGVVWAGTTIGSNITTTGTLTVSGAVYASSTLLSTITENAAANEDTRYNNFTVNSSKDPTAPVSGGGVTALYGAYNWSAGTTGVFTVNGVEGVARSRGTDEAGTFRGGYFRTYTDNENYTGATARTSVGIEASVRTAAGNVAESGTAFVGARVWMAPYFTGGSVGNVNNFAGLWLYNESATNAVTDAIKINDAGTTGWTYGLDMNGATVGTADLRLHNGALVQNTDASTLTITEGTVAVVGNETVSGKSTLSGGAAIIGDYGLISASPVSYYTLGVGGELAIDFETAEANKTALDVYIGQDGTASTDQLKGAKIVASNDVGDNAEYLTGLEVKARGWKSSGAVVGKINQVLRGINVSSDARDQNVATQRGIEINIDGGSSGNSGAGTADLIQGIYLANNRPSGTTQTAAYGLYFAGGAKGFTADIRLSSGAEIKSGNLASPEASNVDCAVVGSLYTSTNDGSLWSCTVAGVGAAATWTAR